MNSLKRELNELFKDTCAAQTRSSEAQAETDRREWDRRHADIAFCETGRQLESQRMELYQANQLTDQAQRETKLAM